MQQAQGKGSKSAIQRLGSYLSGMVMPNIGALIAWGIITALFIPDGPFPNANLAEMVGPMITYLIPILIAYQGGYMVHGQRGAVVGVIGTIGVIQGAPEAPMLLAAMGIGPLGAFLIKKFDQAVGDSIPTGFGVLQFILQLKDKYDLILSTIFLQGFEEEYKVVTPLLMEDEMKSIKRYVRQVMTEKTKKRYSTEKISLQQDADELSFQEFYSKVTDINRILENFNVVTIESQETLSHTLLSICETLNGTVLDRPATVAVKLEKRMEIAPIGLPNTGMALFHCIDESIKFPYFGIYDISETYKILNMEKNEMDLQRVLILLAPEPMDEHTQEIMGAISASIVENNFQLQMFDKGRKDLIEHYLSGLFLGKVK